jgi:hypothetical protein
LLERIFALRLAPTAGWVITGCPERAALQHRSFTAGELEPICGKEVVSRGDHRNSKWSGHVRSSLIIAAGVLAALSIPLGAQAQGVVRGGEQGAAEGGRVAGPVGAAVGGVVGGVTGGVIGGVDGVLGIHHRHYVYYEQYGRRHYR